ncbi:MAG: acyclic terpene utilization AtuA family protein [Chloroflexi bacterium]|nr:acyclic terpene utilization AtuA family protein [Chloroflexota bacterium]
MAEARALAATGILGSGFAESSLAKGLEWDPHFIGADAGSTDLGPQHLGAGTTFFSKEAVKRDLRLMIKGGQYKKIPVLVGTAGGAGGDVHLEGMRRIIAEIAEEEGLHFRAAFIHSEQDKAFLKAQLRSGKIKPLKPAPPVDEQVIEKSERIVAMMGPEPFINALDAGAEVIITGRSSDTSIFAAVPLKMGLSPGPIWHAAKILECGAAVVEQRPHPDCMFAFIRDDHFVVRAPNPTLRCTPVSVAAHTLYENPDPYILIEPPGTLDTSEARYEPQDEVAVRVSGSKFIQADQYTVKLEGAERVGYQSIIIGAFRDPVILEQLDDYLDRIKQTIVNRVEEIYSGEVVHGEDYTVTFKVYGRDGVMGALEPVKEVLAHEICVIIEITAQDERLTNAIAVSASQIATHVSIPQWTGHITSIAYPYSPQVLQRGEVYRFNLNHILELDDPCEIFPMDIVDF